MKGYEIGCANCLYIGLGLMSEKKFNNLILKIPDVALSERSEPMNALFFAVEQLMSKVEELTAENRLLRDELLRAKGGSGRPQISPSTLGKDNKAVVSPEKGKRAGSFKLSKTAELEIHKDIVVEPVNLPPGSRFKGYRDWVVQEVELNVKNLRYKLERWITPDGIELTGMLPDSVKGSHFGPTLKSYVLYLHIQLRATQPLIRELLLDLGIKISSGQIDSILSSWGESLSKERADILSAGLEVAPYIQTDDTGARHKGKNGVCTQIGGDFFTYFASSNSKSRINFIQLLQGENKGYLLNDFSKEYLSQYRITEACLDGLPWNRVFTPLEWQTFLDKRPSSLRAREITEAALLGYATEHGLRKDLQILSDDAGQFNILTHALCWYHAERPLQKLIPLTELDRKELELIREQFWELYQDLKIFKESPSEEKALQLRSRFITMTSTITSFQSLNLVLQRLQKNEDELLRVLSHPSIPLHNNGSEREIREYVTRRKISSGTRSDLGRLSRDTFLTLKKTTRKLKISLWKFILDRVSATNDIPPLADIIRCKYSH